MYDRRTESDRYTHGRELPGDEPARLDARVEPVEQLERLVRSVLLREARCLLYTRHLEPHLPVRGVVQRALHVDVERGGVPGLEERRCGKRLVRLLPVPRESKVSANANERWIWR